MVQHETAAIKAEPKVSPGIIAKGCNHVTGQPVLDSHAGNCPVIEDV